MTSRRRPASSVRTPPVAATGLLVGLLAIAPIGPESAVAASAELAQPRDDRDARRAERDRERAARAFDRAFAAAVRAELESIMAGVAEGGSVAVAASRADAVFDRVLAWGSPDEPELLRDVTLARRLLRFTASLPEPDHAAAVGFLLRVPDVARRLAFLVRPEVDDVPRAMRVLARLAAVGGERIDAYPDLVAAICVVHDRDIRRRVNESAVSGLDPVAVFEHLVANERRLVNPPRRMPAELLLHVVDVTSSAEDLGWALDRYGRDADIDERFEEIDYDTEHLRSGRPKAVTRLGLTLPNIKRHGGVCADQAYFAAGVGKAIGVPAAFVAGRTGANAHAWVGFVRSDRGGIRWDFDAGRYDEYRYVRGTIEDPQSGEAVPDSHVATLVPVALAPAEDREIVVALTDAARRLEELGRAEDLEWPPAAAPEPAGTEAGDGGAAAGGARAAGEADRDDRRDRRRDRSRDRGRGRDGRDAAPEIPEPVRDPRSPGTAAALELLRTAVERIPAHLEPWRVVQELAAEDRMDLAAKRDWAESAWRLCGTEWSDLFVDVVSPMIDSIDEPGPRTALWDEVYDRVADGRPDLGVEIRTAQARIWEAAGQMERAYQCWELALGYAGSGAPVQHAAVAAATLLSSGGRGDLVLPMLESTWDRLERPSGPRAIQFARADDWVMVGRLYAEALREAGRGRDAEMVETQVASVLR